MYICCAYSPPSPEAGGYEGLLACKHITNEKLLEELYTIVDFGGFVIDVIIDHEHYGQLSGKLSISSRYEADLFMEKAKKDTGRPLSLLIGGVHLHRRQIGRASCRERV